MGGNRFRGKTLFIYATIVIATLACGRAYQAQYQFDSSEGSSDLIPMGDMLLDKKRIKRSQENQREGRTQGFTDLSYTTSYWEDGVVPLKFVDPPTAKQRASLMEACLEWSKRAGVKCTTARGDYPYTAVYLTGNRSDCSSSVGIIKDGGVLNLGEFCWNPGTLIHELGHTLGFAHEHQRPDRDEYIEVIRENIAEGFDWPFEILQTGRVLSPYDFESIMHYTSGSFGITPGLQTLRPREPYGNRRLGGSLLPTELDAQSLQAMYGPARLEYYQWQERALSLVQILYVASLGKLPDPHSSEGAGAHSSEFYYTRMAETLELGLLGLDRSIDSVVKTVEYRQRKAELDPEQLEEDFYLNILGRSKQNSDPPNVISNIRRGKDADALKFLMHSREFSERLFSMTDTEILIWLAYRR